ncbi:MAG: hypothetical protein II312_08325, partial [Lachnospiraceae bacterium]|nr:hypothetical protein [Lachnospiraceae bacterium]
MSSEESYLDSLLKSMMEPKSKRQENKTENINQDSISETVVTEEMPVAEEIPVVEEALVMEEIPSIEEMSSIEDMEIPNLEETPV